MGKWPFWAKNGKCPKKDPKMAIFGKKKNCHFWVILDQNWENNHFDPKKGKWHKKTQKCPFLKKKKREKIGHFGTKMRKYPCWAKNGHFWKNEEKKTFLGHFGQNWENDHFGHKKVKWY